MASNKPRDTKPPTTKGIWMRNVAKSFGYIGLGSIKETMPGLSESVGYTKDTIESAKEVLDKMKGHKGLEKLDVLLNIETSKYLSKVKELKDNVISDIKTGNIYNHDRVDKLMNAGFEDFDFDDSVFDTGDDDFSFDDDFDDYDDDDKEVVVPNITVNSNINKNNPMVQAVAQSTATMSAIAESTAKRDVELASAQMTLSTELTSRLSGNLGTINSNLGLIVDFNSNVMNKFAESSIGYYESSLSTLGAILVEIKKMTGNAEKDTYSKDSPFSASDVFSYGGGFNINEYLAKVKKNAKAYAQNSMLGASLGMMTADAGGVSFLDTMLANPIGSLLELVVTIPESVSKILNKFDESVTSFIPALIGKITGWADHAPDTGPSMLYEAIGKIFGIDVRKKTVANIADYERGPVPFDGIVKKSIVEVIPGYLSKILSVLSHDEPITFNYKKGEFENVYTAKQKFYDDARKSVLYEYDEYDDVIENLGKRITNKTEYERIRERLDNALVKMANTKGAINYKDVLSEKGGLRSIFNTINDPKNIMVRDSSLSDTELAMMSEIFSELSPAKRMRMFAGTSKMNAAESYTNTINNLEENDPQLASLLWNKLYDNLNRDATNNNQNNNNNNNNDDSSDNSNEARLKRLKELIKSRELTRVPNEYEDLELDNEAQMLINKNKREKSNKKFKLFKEENNPITKFLAKILERPLGFIGEKVDNLAVRLNDAIFPDPDEETEKGPLLQRIKNKIVTTFNKIKDGIHDGLFGEKGFFTQIKESDLYKSITEKGNKLMDFLLGNGNQVGLFSAVIERFMSLGEGVGNFFTGPDGVFTEMKKSFTKTTNQMFSDYVTGARGSDSPIKNAIDYGGESLKMGFQHFGNLMFGPETFSDGTKNNRHINTTQLAQHVKDNAPAATGNALIGGVLASIVGSTSTGIIGSVIQGASSSGLLGSLFLGPLGGVVAGFVGTLLLRSDKFNNFMFGAKDVDGNRLGGFVSKKTQDWAKENKSSILKGGIGGAVGGIALGGFLPNLIFGGPIPGAIFGIATTITYKSESMQNLLFGNVIDPKTGKRDNTGIAKDIKKFFGYKTDEFTPEDKQRIIGAIGAGALGGIGLFGVLNLPIMLGAFTGIAAGLTAASDKWTERIFGVDDGTGRRTGGLLDKLITGLDQAIITPIALGVKETSGYFANWLATKIKEPIQNTLAYVGEGIKGYFAGEFRQSFVHKYLINPIVTAAKSTFKFIGKTVAWVGKKTLGAIGTIGKKIGGGLLRFARWAGLSSISTPVRGIGAAIRSKASRYMSKETEKRLKDEHNARMAGYKAENQDRKARFKEFKNSIKDRGVLGSFLDSISNNTETDENGQLKLSGWQKIKADKAERKAEKKRNIAKYGRDYKKLNSVDKARIKTEEDQAKDIASIKDIASNILNFLRNGPPDPNQDKIDKLKTNMNSLAKKYGISLPPIKRNSDGKPIDDEGNVISEYQAQLNASRTLRGWVNSRNSNNVESSNDTPTPPESSSGGGNKLDRSMKGIVKKMHSISDRLGIKIPSLPMNDDGQFIDDDGNVLTMREALMHSMRSFTRRGIKTSRYGTGDKHERIKKILLAMRTLSVRYNIPMPNITVDNDGVVYGEDGNPIENGYEYVSNAMHEMYEKVKEARQKIHNLTPSYARTSRANGQYNAPQEHDIHDLFRNPMKNLLGGAEGNFTEADGGNVDASQLASLQEIIRGGHATDGDGTRVKAGGKIDPDSLDAETNPRVAESSEGVKKGLLSALTGKDSPLASMLGIFKNIGAIVAPIAAKAGLLGVLAIGIINLFTNPAQFFEGVIDLVGTSFKLIMEGLLTPLWDWITGKNKTTEKSVIEKAMSSDTPKVSSGIANSEESKEQHGYLQNWTVRDSETGDYYLPKSLPDAGTGLENTDKSKAIGERNVNENSTYYLHKNEGVLTAAANHLFGGAETTAGVLNAYARNNTGKTDAAALSSIMQGTLDTQNTNKEVPSTLIDTIFGDPNNYRELETYIKGVRDDSLTVSDSAYWKYDESNAKKFGGMSKALFKLVRMVNYPSRLISTTLSDVSDDMTEVESTVSTDNSSSLGSKIKKTVSNIFSGIKNMFGGTGGGGTTQRTTSSRGGEKIDIGMDDGYYKFPSCSTYMSDVNPNRTTSFGTSAHRGLDLLVRDRNDLSIKSTTGGKVIFAGQSGRTINDSYGNMVQVEDENGFYHLYGHLNSVNVRQGDIIKPGSILGIEGTTGQSDGNHLHYEVGTGINPGVNLTGEIHPAEYLQGYHSGSSVIRATPVSDYVTGSFWDGTSSTAQSYATSGNASAYYDTDADDADFATRIARGDNLLSILYSPFSKMTSAMKAYVKGDPNEVGSHDDAAMPSAMDGTASATNLSGDTNIEKVWNYLTKKAGFTKQGAAGVIGNIRAESGVIPNNLQNIFNDSTGMSDEQYTKVVDNGSYTDFGADEYGYGLVQWTSPGRKPGLLDYAKSKRKSIGDMGMQLEYMVSEMKSGYPTLYNMATTSGNSLYDVSTHMVKHYEVPAGYNLKSTHDYRASLGDEVLAAYGGGGDDITTRHNTYTRPTQKVQITPAAANTIANTQVITLISEAITILSQIAINTKSSATHLNNIETNTKVTASSGSASNSEMYDIAAKAKTQNNSVSSQGYKVAKVIAQGY